MTAPVYGAPRLRSDPSPQRGWTVVAAVATAATAWLGLAAPADAARTISTGHIDALDVDYGGGKLTLDIRDHTVAPPKDDVKAGAVQLRVLRAARTTVPSGGAYAFLGPAGSPVWILPQTQRTDLLWPGWDTNDVPTGALAGNQVTLELVSKSGPGAVAVYTSSTFGSPQVIFNTSDGLPDRLVVARGVHAHANWAFRASGRYTLRFRATAATPGGQAKTSGLVSFTFVVD